VSYKTYPHIDMQDTGKKAGNILQKIMKNEVKARVLTLSLPMIRESNMGRTDVGAMVDRIRKIKEYEEVPGILAVSINAGFPTNILECGPTVVIVYDEMMGGSLSDTQEVMDGYLAFANHIAMDIWNRRYEVVNKYSSVEEVAQIACEYNRSDNNGPLIIADYADNPGKC
jgi:microcystin degradation protein MlrC